MRIRAFIGLVTAVQSFAAPAALAAQTPAATAAPAAASAGARPALTIPMPGIEAFHPVTTTVAVGSNASPEAMPALKRAGFDVVVAIRQDGEEGYDRQAAERAATEAGLRFISIPFTRANPDPAAARAFLDAMAAPENRYAYVYCNSGARAATMWLIKRVRQDGWTLERAMTEAESLGLSRAELKQFATDFLAGSTR